MRDVISCVERLVGIRIKFNVADASFDTNESGRVFSLGFFVGTVLAVAIAASVYSVNGETEAVAFCENGYVTLDVSYGTAKRKAWSGYDMLARIADVYGIPLRICETDGRLRCLVIPEYADDALRGLKENTIWARTFTYSFERSE